MRDLAIIHFAPLELYPPTQNLLHQLTDNGREIIVLTNETTANIGKFNISGSNINIKRIRRMHQSQIPAVRYLNYFFFYLISFVLLLKHRPSIILYFETLSSFPAYLYKTFINRRVKTYIHYHEYMSLKEYSNGMKLVKFFHKLEKKLYPTASWVSHTNEYRMNRFIDDIYPVRITNPKILPNYPPGAWSSTEPTREKHVPLRIVYAGALSLSTMYLKEFEEWVAIAKGKGAMGYLFA